MKGFVSSSAELGAILNQIVKSDDLHARWINTLSYLENSGARKIAACEHPTLVKEEMLKHAAEEFRHAHHLKKQMGKLPCQFLENYSRPYLLGGYTSLHFITALESKSCRYLSKVAKISKEEIKKITYFLVTYLIELRAAELYSIYHEILRRYRSKINVVSIFLEEKEHLNEMIQNIQEIPSGLIYASDLCAIEGALFKRWIKIISEEVGQALA
jgi:hypothetical protein